MTKTIRIVVVDDQPLMQCALCEQLSRQDDFTIVGCAGNMEDAIAMLRPARPTVILFNLDMTGPNFPAVVRRIRSIQPDIGTVLLTAHLQDSHIDDALSIRANALLTTRVPVESMVKAIRCAARGTTYFCNEVSARVIGFQRSGSRGVVAKSRAALLTGREIEVLRHIASGMAVKEIAKAMTISPKTVDSHRAHLMTKLAIHDRVHLTRFAIREGLVRS